jgi:monoamine oxidase
MSEDRKSAESITSAIDRRTLLKRAALGLVAGGTLSRAARAASRNRDVFDVVVIGAGISGLTAARDLKKAGLDNFVVLEARDRVGGRTLNADIGGGYVSEVGGQWIGHTQTAVADLARELELGLFQTYNTGKTAFLSGSDVTLLDLDQLLDSGLAGRLDALAREVPLDAPWSHPRAREFDSMTFADWLATQNIPADQQWTLRTGTILTFGAPPDQLSMLWVLFYVHSAGSYAELEGTAGQGAQAFRVIGGTQAISLAMAHALGAHVQLSTPVTRIRQWETIGPVEVETQHGILRARRVIMALSPSQAHFIDFDPVLPVDRATLQKRWPATTDMTKAAMVYERPFWRDAGLSGQSFTVDDGVYLWAWDNSPPDGGVGVISCFIGPKGTGMTQDARKAALIDSYVKYLGPPASRPTHYHEQYWMLERYTKGCVSPLGTNLFAQYGPALRPTVGCIEWAGAETAAIWNGYMDGAVRAGHEAALRTLRMI